jgi:hypothetical protein
MDTLDLAALICRVILAFSGMIIAWGILVIARHNDYSRAQDWRDLYKYLYK